MEQRKNTWKEWQEQIFRLKKDIKTEKRFIYMIGFSLVFSGVWIGLKLLGIQDWNWWAITAPLWVFGISSIWYYIWRKKFLK